MFSQAMCKSMKFFLWSSFKYTHINFDNIDLELKVSYLGYIVTPLKLHLFANSIINLNSCCVTCIKRNERKIKNK